ncbi:MmpS family transport accessory protein [Streptomyces anulatus]|uniref:MmpS family transport accessory protein n=1 Tax=Streptomyces anulatus TaxID=1892 RepID=UPI002251452E|nr:MmpS family transport accessory protein [Streptomyces anulatus]MCX4520687.1 MmpS family transport accessory protein [Streptomyces anulatus]MCX4603556.1 MmpS family transport accessory protein [Streptomyces anulatus]WSI79863.1 MmpS family transport accessory protein [Streptomyces anulatus]
MNRTIRTARTARTARPVGAAAHALAIAGLVLGLGACSAESVDEAIAKGVDTTVDEKYEVTYEVTGKSVDEITYHGGAGEAMEPELETVTSPTLPWKKTVELRGIMPPAVMPVAVDAGGADITCTITYKGKVIKEAKGEGMLTAGGCVAVSPIVG